MSTSRRRLLLLILALPVITFLAALLYMVGMTELEENPRDFGDSLEWAAETITTTGYGGDSSWDHPVMIAFVIVLQFLGVFLVFLVFPIYLIPFLEERFETRLPAEAPKMSGHLVVYHYGPAVESLLERTNAGGVPTVVVEPDAGIARRLFESGQPVVHAELSREALRAARVPEARAVIANGSDDEDATLTLAARQLGFEGDILALVEEPYHRKPMMLAGASAVFTPRHILGAALAARASPRVSPRLAGIQQLGDHLEVREIRLPPDSPLAGTTLGEAGIGAETGATVVGQWVGGELVAQPTAEMRMEPGGILVVVGSEESLSALVDLAEGAAPLARSGAFVVGGYGEVGRKVVELLTDVGEEVCVIDRREIPEEERIGGGTYLTGDILDPRILESARVDRAQAVVLALDTDSATLFATVIVEDQAPHVPIIARVNQAENVERIHRAGADFALSISQVSGQMLARRLLGEEAVVIDPQLQVSRVRPEGLAGETVAAASIRERTGVSVVAVERGEELLVELAPDLRFERGDIVYVAGSESAVRGFEDAFGR